MTLDLYGHLYPDEMDRRAARLSEWAVSNLCPTGVVEGEPGQAAGSGDVR
jgi:hypothetical protein